MLADRLSGGFIAILTAYMILLQAFLGSFADGLAAGRDFGPVLDHVICGPSGITTAGAGQADGGNGVPGPHDCPCAVLCQFVGHAPVMAPTADPIGVADILRAASAIRIPPGQPLAPTPRENGLLSEARAPPVLPA